MPGDELLLEGFLAVEAAIEAGWRNVHELVLAEDKRYDRRLSRLRLKAEAAGIAVSTLPREAINDMATGDTHSGIIARVGARQFCAPRDLLPSDDVPFIVMLDGIEDPYNFAGAIRALYAAGVDGVVLRQRNWTSASAIVGRASAGTIERIPLAIAESAEAAADFFRGQGLTIAATAKAEAALPLGRSRSYIAALYAHRW